METSFFQNLTVFEKFAESIGIQKLFTEKEFYSFSQDCNIDCVDSHNLVFSPQINIVYCGTTLLQYNITHPCLLVSYSKKWKSRRQDPNDATQYLILPESKFKTKSRMPRQHS